MKSNTLKIAVIILLAGSLLSACQMRLGSKQAGTVAGVSAISVNATDEPTATPRPVVTRKPRPSATPTQDPALAQAAKAEQAARAYFAELEKGNSEQAAEQLSSFSLMVFGMTRGDAASDLHKQMAVGAHWSGLEVTGNNPMDDQTFLVHVRYTFTDQENKKVAMDELWPIRLENGAWRYNWGNLIDYHSLTVEAQTVNGVTVKPVQLNRFSDRVQLVLLVQNRTNAAVVFGQPNEILGTFHFGDKTIEAEKAQIILNPLRSVPDVKLEVKGLYTRYPDSIEIRRWKTYQVKPWYLFLLQ